MTKSTLQTDNYYRGYRLSRSGDMVVRVYRDADYLGVFDSMFRAKMQVDEWMDAP